MPPHFEDPREPDTGNGPKFDAMDRLTIIFLALMLILTTIGFFLYVRWHGLLTFADSGTYSQDRYFLEALSLRERRLALVLTYRTFLTTLGFTVGLVLAALGGMFLLRRATMDFAFKADGDAKGVSNARLSLVMNSPGVAFMLGGVAVILVTQLLALPVGAPEIFPENAQALCASDQRAAKTCSTGNEQMKQIAKMAAYCARYPDTEGCQALETLNKSLETK